MNPSRKAVQRPQYFQSLMPLLQNNAKTTSQGHLFGTQRTRVVEQIVLVQIVQAAQPSYQILMDTTTFENPKTLERFRFLFNSQDVQTTTES